MKKEDKDKINTSNSFVDDNIVSIKDDLDRIRIRPTMYISYLGSKGTLHLTREGVNNIIDECINTKSPGDTGIIEYYEKLNKITLVDNGRGINFDDLEAACTKMQTGSKMAREGTGDTAGENGAGMKAMNALSKYFEIRSYRDGKVKTIVFEGGKKTKDVVKQHSDKDKHGLELSFIPSEFYLGNPCNLVSGDLASWLSDIQYMMDEKIGLKFHYFDKDNHKEVMKFRNKGGLGTLLTSLPELKDNKHIFKPVVLTNSKVIKDVVKTIDRDQNITQKEIEKKIKISFAFSFTEHSNYEIINKSYCNYIHTTEGGVHVNAVHNALTSFIIPRVKKSLSLKEAESLTVLNQDVFANLVSIINLSSEVDPGFESQTKQKVGKQMLYSIIRDLTTQALKEYFDNNPKELERICQFVRLMAKARVETNKMKNNMIKKDRNILSHYDIEGYTPPNHKKKGQYREIVIIEGDSAESSCDSARNKDICGLFKIDGVPGNAYAMTVSQVMASDMYKNLTLALGAQLGKHNRAEDCEFNKIILMPDADADGHFIRSELAGYFLKHQRAVVEDGRLYVVVTPLYKINDAKNPFVNNKLELVELFEKKISNNLQLSDSKNNILDKSKLRELLYVTRDYRNQLSLVSDYLLATPVLVENIVERIVASNDKNDLVKSLKQLCRTSGFDELQVDVDGDGIIDIFGDYEGVYQYISLDKTFMKKSVILRELSKQVMNLNHNSIHYTLINKRGEVDTRTSTIGECYNSFDKYIPAITTRFKGLGELESEELQETAFNPKRRQIIRLTIEDLEQALNSFDILHGKGTKYISARADLIGSYTLDRELFDN